MKLLPKQVRFLKQCLKKSDENEKLYLFGSRIDNTRSGGEIDLLIITQKLKRTDLWMFREPFYEQFCEQKKVIVLTNPENLNLPLLNISFPKH